MIDYAYGWTPKREAARLVRLAKERQTELAKAKRKAARKAKQRLVASNKIIAVRTRAAYQAALLIKREKAHARKVAKRKAEAEVVTNGN